MSVTVQAGRCQHCGRAVRYTVHTRENATVDYYRTVTGTPRVDSIEDPSGSGTTLRIVRVDEIREFLTCRDCWPMSAIQDVLDEARRTGSLRARPRA